MVISIGNPCSRANDARSSSISDFAISKSGTIVRAIITFHAMFARTAKRAIACVVAPISPKFKFFISLSASLSVGFTL